MDDGFLTMFGLAWLLAFGVAAAASIRHAFLKPSEELSLVLTIAAMEANERKQARIGELHLVLALTCDPAVRERLARAIALDDLRERLAAALDASPADDPGLPGVEPGAAVVQRAFSKEVTSVIRRARRRPGHPPSPFAVMDVVIRAAKGIGGPLAEAFAAVGLDAKTWRAPTAKARPKVVAPYRGEPAAPPPADVAVRLWNDDKTTMEFVVATLGGRFGLPAFEARYVMLRVHRLGSARAAELARADAERIVESVRGEAREKGYPLELTIEPLVPQKKRWFRPASLRSG